QASGAPESSPASGAPASEPASSSPNVKPPRAKTAVHPPSASALTTRTSSGAPAHRRDTATLLMTARTRGANTEADRARAIDVHAGDIDRSTSREDTLDVGGDLLYRLRHTRCSGSFRDGGKRWLPRSITR